MDAKERMNIKMGSEEGAADKESFYGEGKYNQSLEGRGGRKAFQWNEIRRCVSHSSLKKQN